MAAGIRGRISLGADAGPGSERAGNQPGHGKQPEHGPAAVRRRGIRQDGGEPAGGLQGHHGQQAGGAAGADHNPGAAALQHHRQALPAHGGAGGLPEPVPDNKGTEGSAEAAGGGGNRHHHRYPPAAGEGRQIQGPGPLGGGRGAALRRDPQGGHQADEALGGRADADGHADPPHAAHEHGGHTGYVPAPIPAGGALPGADLRGGVLRRPGAGRHPPGAQPGRAGVRASQPGADPPG